MPDKYIPASASRKRTPLRGGSAFPAGPKVSKARRNLRIDARLSITSAISSEGTCSFIFSVKDQKKITQLSLPNYLLSKNFCVIFSLNIQRKNSCFGSL